MLVHSDTGKPLETQCVVNAEGRVAHIRAALARGLPVCTREKPHGRRVAIVGSGPSLNDFKDELIAFDGEIWAINRAYDYLAQVFGRIPDGFIGLDPQEALKDSLQNPHKSTTFYMASCCHPAAFDALDGFSVRIWHSNGETVSALPSGSIMVPGGVTAITRAPFLAYLQGCRDVWVFGGDCSYEEQPYAYATEEARCDPNDRTIVVRCPPGDGAFYKTELGLLHQAENLGRLQECWFKDAALTFRCGGLLPAFLASTQPSENFIDAA